MIVTLIGLIVIGIVLIIYNYSIVFGFKKAYKKTVRDQTLDPDYFYYSFHYGFFNFFELIWAAFILFADLSGEATPEIIARKICIITLAFEAVNSFICWIIIRKIKNKKILTVPETPNSLSDENDHNDSD